MAAVAVAGPVHLPRPRPAVIQAPSRPWAGYMHNPAVSDSSAPATPLCSNPNTGESWFQIPSPDYSSSSSHSCVPPLPKGARPPSPQLHGLGRDAAHPFEPSHNAGVSRPRPSRSSSSWKLEWRGISKVVKWAFLGDRNDEAVEPRQRRNNSRLSDPQEGDRHPKSGPRDERVRYAAPPPPPLSPSTSTTCVDVTYDGVHMHSKSELGHGSEVGHKTATRYHGVLSPAHPSVPLRGIDARGSRNNIVSRHESHSQTTSRSTVYHGSASEHGHQWIDGSHLDPGNTYADVEESVISHESTPYWRLSARDVQSDIGHGASRYAVPGLASSVSLSNGHAHAQKSHNLGRPLFSSFRSAKSATSLPVSCQPLQYASNDRHRPRKLRKSMPGSPPPPVPSISLSKPSASVLPLEIPLEPVSPMSRSSYVNSSLTTPLSSTKSLSRRKLTKRRFSTTAPSPPKVIASTITPIEMPISVAGMPPSQITDSPVAFSPDKFEDETSVSFVTAMSAGIADGNSPHKRPSMLRTESNRRWTVAVADVPDDFFIEELERLRRMGRLHAGDVHGIRTVQTEQVQSVEVNAVKGGREGWETQIDVIENSEREERHNVVVRAVTSDFDEETEWLHARRAILCCRELVRTERSYQGRLQELLDGNVCDETPRMLLQYVPALISASKALSARFNEDMSASGVSRAFMHVESSLESAFTAWCSVAGAFFGFQSSSNTSRNHKRKLTSSSMVVEKQMVTPSGIIRIRRISARSRREASESYPSSPTQATDPGHISTNSSTAWLPHLSSNQPSAPSDERESVSTKKSVKKKETQSKEERRRRPPYRELAILPTQRVTRYVLLYKDLLKHTPLSSPARAIIESAVESAVSLAQKCNQAQDKALIIQQP